MKRRLLGLGLVTPLAALMPTMVRGCQRGRVAYGTSNELAMNLLATAFMIAVPLAIVGLSLLLGKQKRSSRSDPDAYRNPLPTAKPRRARRRP